MNIYDGWVEPFSIPYDVVSGIDKYNGLAPNKLVIGVPASISAANSAYYTSPEVLTNTIAALQNKYGKQFAGIMMWDSHWDQLNNYQISNAGANSLFK